MKDTHIHAFLIGFLVALLPSLLMIGILKNKKSYWESQYINERANSINLEREIIKANNDIKMANCIVRYGDTVIARTGSGKAIQVFYKE